MSRTYLTAAVSAVMLVAFAALPASAQYESQRSTTVKSSKSNTSDRKRMGGGGGTIGGGPAGIAVSDEGAPGSKPVKGGKK